MTCSGQRNAAAKHWTGARLAGGRSIRRGVKPPPHQHSAPPHGLLARATDAHIHEPHVPQRERLRELSHRSDPSLLAPGPDFKRKPGTGSTRVRASLPGPRARSQEHVSGTARLEVPESAWSLPPRYPDLKGRLAPGSASCTGRGSPSLPPPCSPLQASRALRLIRGERLLREGPWASTLTSSNHCPPAAPDVTDTSPYLETGGTSWMSVRKDTVSLNCFPPPLQPCIPLDDISQPPRHEVWPGD